MKLRHAVLMAAAVAGASGCGVPPFYMQGPDNKVIPPLLSGWWRHDDGAESTWVTPLFHKTVGPEGKVRHMHALTYFQGPDWKVLFPVYWQWQREDGTIRSFVPLLYSSSRPADDVPSQFQILGGLYARDCNYERGIYRYRILWLFPIGRRRHFTPVGAAVRGGVDAYRRGYRKTAGSESRRAVERWAR